MSEDRYERGRQRMLQIHGERSLRSIEGLGDLGRFILEFAYGEIYSRPGLSLRERQIATVAVLVALGRSSQLPVHLRSSLQAGLSADELREVILQVAVLAGFPTAMNAISTLRTIETQTGDDADG